MLVIDLNDELNIYNNIIVIIIMIALISNEIIDYN